MKHDSMTDEQLRDFKERAIGAYRLAIEVQELRRDNERLREIVSGLLDVGECRADEIDKSITAVRAAQFLEETAK